MENFKINSLSWYINKYGTIDGEKKYKEKNKKIGKSSFNRNTLNGFINRYGEEIGKQKYNDFILKSKHTKEKFILDFGENVGNQKWKNYIEKKKNTSKRSLSYWLNIFDGDYVLAKNSLTLYQSRGLKFYIDLYGDEMGSEKWINRKKNQSEKISILMKNQINRKKHSFNKNDIINKYGIEKWEQIKNSRIHSFDNYILKYGEIQGKQKWKEYLSKRFNGNFYSINSSIFFDELFNEIKKININTENVFYAKLNKEIFIYDDKKIYFFDFTIEDLKIIIEYNGDFWHANPNIYNENFYHPILKMTSREIWEKQFYKINIAKNHGYDVIEIWEKDVNENKEIVLQKCIIEIKNKLKGWK